MNQANNTSVKRGKQEPCPTDGVRHVTVARQPAEEVGLVSRVLVDPMVWDDCVTWTEADTARKGIALDEATRRADVLYLAACALKRDSAEGSGAGRPRALAFTVERVPRITAGREAEKVTLIVTAARSPRGTVTVTIGPAPAAPPSPKAGSAP